MRGITTQMERSTLQDEIAGAAFVPSTVLNYLLSEEGRTAFTTMAFDAIRAEDTIVVYVYSPKEARILRENIRYWLSSRDFNLNLLANAAADAGTNILAPVISGVVRKVITVDLRSLLANFFCAVLRLEHPSIIEEVLHMQGAKLIRISLLEKVEDITGSSLRVLAFEIARGTLREK